MNLWLHQYLLWYSFVSIVYLGKIFYIIMDTSVYRRKQFYSLLEKINLNLTNVLTENYFSIMMHFL